MPFGDSITRGSLDSPVWGYRDHLQDSLGVGVYDFVGPFNEPTSPGVYDADHNGRGGDDTNDLLARVSSNLSNYFALPNDATSKILLMVGTNDIKDGFDEATTVTNVQTLVNTIDAYDPTINVYVATIIPSTNGTYDTNFTSYNAALVTMLETLQGSKENLYIVDMNTAFRTCNSGTFSGCMGDSLHPNNTGYQLISDTWYSCIQSSSNTYCNGN